MKKIFIALLLIIIAVGSGIFYLFHGRGSAETSTKYKEFSFIFEDKDIDKKDFAKIDGQYYLSFDFIKENLDENVSYDANEKTVIFTNDKGTKRIVLGEDEATLNGQKIGLRDPIIEKDGKILIPSEIFIYDYPVNFRFIEEKNLLLLDFSNVNYAKGYSTGDGLNMREDDSINSPKVTILKDKEEVYVYGEKGDFYRVRQVDGYAGYIKKDKLDVEYPIELKTSNNINKKEAVKPLNLTWDYTYGTQSQESINAITKIDGINVISPTWFSIQDKDLNIIDRGKIEYVDKYKAQGIEVWGCFDNSFNGELTEYALQTSSRREILIKRILELTKKYNLSGINIDFEHLNTETRDNLTQFVKELSAVAKLDNIKISIDVTPQISRDVTKEKYDRKNLAKFCDYVILMAYDQHWASSKTAGSVAEYSWVEGNLNSVLRDVPADKLVLGVPLYSRLWTEENGSVKSNSLSMGQVNATLSARGITPKWDDKIKQDYAQYQDGSKTYKIWIEDSRSIEWKTSLVNKYNLAGVASWRKGFESNEIWKTIENVISHINTK